MQAVRHWFVLCLIAVAAAPPLFARVPGLTLKDLDGRKQSLSALRGEIVVLNFWATWCGPCQEELPRLSSLASFYTGRKVRFVAVSLDSARDRAKIEPTLHRLHVDLNVWTGGDADTLQRFGLGNIVPGTIILDARGEPVCRIMGEAREGDIRDAVDWLLNGRSGAAPQPVIRRY